MSVTVSAQIRERIAEIKVRAQQVSEDGQRADSKTGKLIPANFLQQLVIKTEERVLVSADLGGGLAHNPYFLFKVKGLKAGAKISVDWLASQEIINPDGRRETKESNGQVTTVLQG